MKYGAEDPPYLEKSSLNRLKIRRVCFACGLLKVSTSVACKYDVITTCNVQRSLGTIVLVHAGKDSNAKALSGDLNQEQGHPLQQPMEVGKITASSCKEEPPSPGAKAAIAVKPCSKIGLACNRSY